MKHPRTPQTLAALLFVFILCFPFASSAASLSLSPATRSISVGERITVSVFVHTEGVAINAVSGTVSYDPSALEVLSVSKTGSIVTLWVQEPAAASGSVSFEGVILNPGYSGSKGKIIDVVFKAKTEASVPLRITGAAVLANDGLGTNTLSAVSGSSLSITESEVENTTIAVPPEKQTKTIVQEVVGKEKLSITSATHPDQSIWYNKNAGVFTFGLSQGTDALRLVLSRFTNSKPSVVYRPAILEKQLEDIPEGITYLILEALVDGAWSESVAYRIKIDTQAPRSITVVEKERADKTEPFIELLASAEDSGSGLSGFKLFVDGKEGELYPVGEKIQLGPLPPGNHSIEVAAVDRAGNESKKTLSTNIQALIAPQVKGVTREVAWGGTLRVDGVAGHFSGSARIDLYAKGNRFSASGDINPDGTFTISHFHDFPAGEYEAQVITTDPRGAMSAHSEKLHITFKSRPAGDMLLAFGKDLGAGFFVLLSFLGFAGLLSGAYLKFTRWRKRLLKEVREVDATVEKSFMLLRDDVETFVTELAKESGRRKLTAVEKRFVKTMKTNLTEANTILKREISDVKKEVL